MKSKPSPERLKSLFPVSNLVLPSFISLPLTRPSQVWLIFEPDKILQHTTEALPLSWQFMMILTIFKTSSGWNWYFLSILNCVVPYQAERRCQKCFLQSLKMWARSRIPQIYQQRESFSINYGSCNCWSCSDKARLHWKYKINCLMEARTFNWGVSLIDAVFDDDLKQRKWYFISNRKQTFAHGSTPLVLGLKASKLIQTWTLISDPQLFMNRIILFPLFWGFYWFLRQWN